MAIIPSSFFHDAAQISEVPQFPVMPNLTRFNLSHNQLTAMPGCVFQLTGQSSFPHLKHFNLQGNQIATVPKRDAHFCDLEVLNLSKNKISDLSDEFLVSMPALRVLDASTNEICECNHACMLTLHMWACPIPV